jgi:hypothetical protein
VVVVVVVEAAVVVTEVVVAAAVIAATAAAAALAVNHSCSHTGTFNGIQSSSKLVPLSQHKPTHYQCRL